MNKIEELRTCSPSVRVKAIEQLYQKNIDFLSKYRPDIIELIDKITCPYEINVTETFLELIDSKTRSVAHSPSLDNFAQALGQTSHGAWIDIINLQKTVIAGSSVHQKIVDTFSANLGEYFPNIQARLDSGKTTISTDGAGYSVLPPVTFAGIFHGLHIDFLLQNNKINRILLVEPEAERFEVSCYFLDYEWLASKFGCLPLSIGKIIDEQYLHYFHSTDKISSALWTRVLPVYDSTNNQVVVDQIRLNQSSLEGQTTSYDKECRALLYGQENINLKHKVLSRTNKLSDNSKVALIASGPSLRSDMQWLKNNQNKLIIIAVHTAVKPLRENGINVDFQVSLDTHLDLHQFQELELDEETPFVSYYKCPTEFINEFKNALLVTEKNYINSVDFVYTLENTYPSSTNLALAFSLFFHPQEIYLFGVDVGYKNADNRFVSGSFHEVFKRKKDLSTYKVEANHPDTKFVTTTPFFFKVKKSIERTLRENNDVKVFNCSDGAKIYGAEFISTNQIVIPDYVEKQQDIKSIIDSFLSAQNGVNYRNYAIGGKQLTDFYLSTLMAGFDMKNYDWCKFTNVIDTSLRKSISSMLQKSKCLRMTIYERTLVELFLSWYRMFLIAKDKKQAEEVFRKGKQELRKVLNQLIWPLES